MGRFADDLTAVGEESADESAAELTTFISALQRLVADGFFAVFEPAPDHSPAFVRLCTFVIDVSCMFLPHAAVQRANLAVVNKEGKTQFTTRNDSSARLASSS